MSYIKVLIGPHLSGKTGHAVQLMKLFPKMTRVSRADIINMMCPKTSKTIPCEAVLETANRAFITTIITLLENERTVIVDDCNLTMTDLERITNVFSDVVDGISFKVFDEPIGILLRRNENKGKENMTMYTTNTILSQVSKLQELKRLLQENSLVSSKITLEEKEEKVQ